MSKDALEGISAMVKDHGLDWRKIHMTLLSAMLRWEAFREVHQISTTQWRQVHLRFHRGVDEFLIEIDKQGTALKTIWDNKDALGDGYGKLLEDMF